jgi:D-serine deaminase-like pyridoxal phosphate-dependent protein
MAKEKSSDDRWYEIENVDKINSPSLLIYSERVSENIIRMIDIVGDVNRLRPHVKTHKMQEIIKLEMIIGISSYKCATIAETEMVASCGATDILLAIQPVGPNLARFFKLKQAFPGCKISCIADSYEVMVQLSEMALKTGQETHVWIDINNGMNRTGIPPGEEAELLYRKLSSLPMLKAEGLHVYDGHIHEPDYSKREKLCNDSYEGVTTLINNLNRSGFSGVRIIAGGTPTFPIHALRKGVECSPGTLLLWDYGYSSSFKDMDFLHAAILLTRITSKPMKDLLCLDLGHKAVASEMPQPRIKILGLENYTIVSHNEEHMVIRTSEAGKFQPGDPFYCIPWHICPTVDRYDTVSVVDKHIVNAEWKVAARKRKITI